MLDSLAEACESVDDVESAQRYKAEADQLAYTFYGPSTSSKSPTGSPRDPAPPTPTSPRDPASSRRSFAAQPPASPQPPPTGDSAVSESAIREGVASMISQLGLGGPATADDGVEDSLSIRQAERELHETVRRTGGADVMALSVPQTSSTPAQSESTAPRSTSPCRLLPPSDRYTQSVKH